MRGLLSTFSVSVIFYLFIFLIPFLFLTLFSLSPVIGLEISRHSVNQSNAKLKQLRQTSFLFFPWRFTQQKIIFLHCEISLVLYDTYFFLTVRFTTQSNFAQPAQSDSFRKHCIYTQLQGRRGKTQISKKRKKPNKNRVEFKTILWLYARQSNRILKKRTKN